MLKDWLSRRINNNMLFDRGPHYRLTSMNVTNYQNLFDIKYFQTKKNKQRSDFTVNTSNLHRQENDPTEKIHLDHDNCLLWFLRQHDRHYWLRSK